GWRRGRGGERRGRGGGPRRGPWYARSDSGARGQGSCHVLTAGGSERDVRSQGSGFVLLRSRALLGATAEPLLRALSLLDVSPQSRRRLCHLVRSAAGSAPARGGRGRACPVPLIRPRHAIVLQALRELALLRVDPPPGPDRHRSGQHARSDRPAAPVSRLLRRSGRLGRRQRRPSAARGPYGSGGDQVTTAPTTA